MEDNVTALHPTRTARPIPGFASAEVTPLKAALAPLQALEEKLSEQGLRLLISSNPTPIGEAQTVTPYDILRVAVHLKAAQQHHAHNVVYATNIKLDSLHLERSSQEEVDRTIATITQDIRNAVQQYEHYEEVRSFLNP